MKPAARLGDPHECPAVSPTPCFAHVGGEILNPGAGKVEIEALRGAHLADFALCKPVALQDVLSEGAATVLVEGLPAVREGDHSIHGGSVVKGSGTVLIGGPTFSLPSNISIVGPADYQNKVLRDLFLLSTTESGREILRRLGASGQPVVITKLPGFDAAWCMPSSVTCPCGSVINYDPDRSTGKLDGNGNEIAGPSQVTLAHEMLHAMHNAEDDREDGVDPSPPKSEPKIDEEEAKTIGVGSHDHDWPTENSVRKDLGLPLRGNHLGTGRPSKEPRNLRPGGY